MRFISSALLVSLLSQPFLIVAVPRCKVTPSSRKWPSNTQWKALNESVSGRLIVPPLPGAVCQPLRPEFNAEACPSVQTAWTNSSFHASQLASVDYNDDTCPPNVTRPCSAAGYPAYVIKAANANDVQQGVKFAARTGVRLIVKNTGHDYPGRSSGRGSLSIWTHELRGIDIDINAQKAKIGAGEQVGSILGAAAAKNVTIVTGSDLNVGIGGWITGGGHGPVSSLYGLGADQVLAMEVVTADGKLLTVDEKKHADLFWAMRGGGGSTFGVLISVTVRIYPNVPYTNYIFAYNTTANSDTFWNLLTLFHSYLPSISEAGGMGYYFAWPLQTAEPDPLKAAKLVGTFLMPNKSPSEAVAIMAPMDAAINNAKWPAKVFSSNFSIPYPSFSAQWAQNPSQSVGTDARIGSRLLDKAALTGSQSALKTALRKSTPAPWPMLGHLVAGPGVRNATIPGSSNAVLPAWRKTVTHVVLPRMFVPGTPEEKVIPDDLRNVHVQALRDISPGMGAYVNECDPTEPNQPETFWGSNYARLLKIKRRWDPQGVFWCSICVGSEDWIVSGGDAIGQHEGKICRKW